MHAQLAGLFFEVMVMVVCQKVCVRSQMSLCFVEIDLSARSGPPVLPLRLWVQSSLG